MILFNDAWVDEDIEDIVEDITPEQLAEIMNNEAENGNELRNRVQLTALNHFYDRN